MCGGTMFSGQKQMPLCAWLEVYEAEAGSLMASKRRITSPSPRPLLLRECVVHQSKNRRPMSLVGQSGKPQVEHISSALPPKAEIRTGGPNFRSGPRRPRSCEPATFHTAWAMCGRLLVGKGFLHVCSIGRSSHVFGL
jgi:hypothetical protein